MSKLHFFTLILIYSYSLSGQESFILSGYITDVETNEKLIGVNVLLPTLNLGTTTLLRMSITVNFRLILIQ